ncbi:glycosyltransferase [Tropicimonas sediminicola]|uniref:Glycosyltransferase Alg8 n=1 Tax=Tropicimonas sediminicola TaxID=1031541 RepID=A0A239MJJ5_9RHOB|nr:glycosyltransferase [Tropicimonas sediminicola]SNT42821.1 glycosyltransferase Alg8 [Tropicimonas sediminicola]
MLGHLAYLTAMVLLATTAPLHQLGEARGALLVLGVVGIWRYSWAFLNFSRAVAYLRVVYPKRRAEAEAAFATRPVRPHAFFLTTSYKIEPAVTVRVYRSIFAAAAASEGGATIVASVVDPADARLIRRTFSGMARDMSTVKLRVDQIPGTGKRDALARSLELIARDCPTRHDVVTFVDGDSCVPEDLVARCAPVFTDPRIGALTTDERAEIDRPGLFEDWFNLRFAQRQVMMCSMGLSARVLTLTGRMSVFRADLATNPGFIAMVQSDSIQHWRLGHVKFLTGDDKSTWFWLLSNGYRTAYLPDVSSLSMESQPRPGFVDSAVTLMTRWYGNMMRTNGRALGLGPARIGAFTWWSLLDQRVSIWTTLAGPTGVILTALLAEPMILPVYAAWVMGTRYVYCSIVSGFRGRAGFPISYPFLLYFGQIVGALVKSFIIFRLDRQKWTRQSTATGAAAALTTGQRLRMASSTYLHALTVGWLVVCVLFLTKIA